ncbi:MAG: hypothetical protein WCG27_00560, partial [Pseudomonadota bacterium]
SLDPEKITEIALQKLALRNTFLEAVVKSSAPTGGSEKIPAPEKKIIAPSLPAAPMKTESPLPAETEKNWEGFLGFLSVKSPALTSNLEQGNLISPVAYQQEKIFINLGLGPAEKVFWEYLQDQDINQKLVQYLSDFFEKGPDKIILKLTLLDENQKKSLNFASLAEMRKNEDKEKDNVKQQNLVNNPVVKQAAHLFNSKIDKVILHEEK